MTCIGKKSSTVVLCVSFSSFKYYIRLKPLGMLAMSTGSPISVSVYFTNVKLCYPH